MTRTEEMHDKRLSRTIPLATTLVCGIALCGASAAWAYEPPILITSADHDLRMVRIRGKPFTIYGTPRQGFVATFDGQAFPLNEVDESAGIRAVVAGGGKTYVVEAGNCGGTACLDTYRIFDVTSDHVVVADKEAGSGLTTADQWHVLPDGTLTATLRKPDGTGTEVISYKDGHLQDVDHNDSQALEGPDTPPGGDYAAMLNGKPMSYAFKSRAVEPKLRAALGPKAFEDIRKLALQDFGGPFQQSSDGSSVTTFVCEPHNCGPHSVTLLVTADGKVAAFWQPNGGPAALLGHPDPLEAIELQRR